MFNVWFCTQDNIRDVASMDGKPIAFNTMDDCWNFIRATMDMPVHPKFMWVREIKEKEIAR